MVRLKFFLFALLVLGLGVAHLPLVSGPLSVRATEGAPAQATAAISEVARALEARRFVVQGLALKLAANADISAAVQPQVVPLPRGKGIRIVEPPIDERFAGLRAATQELVPEALKGSVVLALATQEGSLYARAEEEAVSDDKLDVRALLKAGAEGLVVDAFEVPHVFFSMPVLWSAEGGRPRVAATVVVGAPLRVDVQVLESAAVSSGVAALALVRGDKVVGLAGSNKELANEALKVLRVGQAGHVVRRGSVRALLPQLPRVKLPLLTSPEDLEGGQAPLAVGTRRALEGTGYEVVAVSSVRPFMLALADYQQTAFFGLVGLLGFSLVWLLVMGSGGSAAAPARKEEKKKDKKGKKGQEEADSMRAPVSAPSSALPLAAAPPRPEPPVPGPDDFPFPTPAAPAAARPAPPPVADASGGDAFPFPPPAPVADAYPFSPAGPAQAPGVASVATPRGAFAFEDQPTAAYSLRQAADPFAAATAQSGPAPLSDSSDSPSEATRVAAIPKELLRAARPVTGETPTVLRPGVAAPSAMTTPVMGSPTPGMGNNAVALSEEQHFQEVFREFVAIRDECGEPNDGLTYDKFVAKLRKNKEQLVQKYACKTVRFQVYVKEGKAALKATPVKE
jgi:hypothetical protein